MAQAKLQFHQSCNVVYNVDSGPWYICILINLHASVLVICTWCVVLHGLCAWFVYLFLSFCYPYELCSTNIRVYVLWWPISVYTHNITYVTCVYCIQQMSGMYVLYYFTTKFTCPCKCQACVRELHRRVEWMYTYVACQVLYYIILYAL